MVFDVETCGWACKKHAVSEGIAGLLNSVPYLTWAGNAVAIESRSRAIFFAPVHTGPEAHPATCILGPDLFPGAKVVGAWR